jgi:8-oxo-dGTP diphosphatase
MEIEFYELGEVEEENLKFAVISTVYKGKWVYVRHKKRDTWEIPGGHREMSESIDYTAKRELFEETGAKEFNIKPVCDYSMNDSNGKLFGRLFFSEINEIGELPISEISEVKLFDELPEKLTYPLIQPFLYKKTLKLR